MKQFKCLDCEENVTVQTTDEALKALMPHYMEKHKDIMETNSEEDKAEWMKRFYQQWEETPEQ